MNRSPSQASPALLAVAASVGLGHGLPRHGDTVLTRGVHVSLIAGRGRRTVHGAAIAGIIIVALTGRALAVRLLGHLLGEGCARLRPEQERTR